MAYTYRNVVQRALTYAELDENFQTVDDQYTEALQAQDAATLNAGIYASTTAGLAATTNGQYFSVPSAGTDVYLELYKNNAGSAVLTKTYYSRPQAAMEEAGSYAVVNAYTGSATVFYVRCKTNIFDSAHGVFRRDDTDTTSADNGGTILVDALSRRWKREFSGEINVKWFGAVGDGVTDDAAAIQSSIDFAASRPIFAPAGTYKVATGLTYNTEGLGYVSGLKLRGDGKYRTILNNSTGGPLIVCTSGTATTDRQYNVAIENLSITNSASSPNTIGIQLIGVFQSAVRNVRVVNQASHGIHMYSSVGDATDCSQVDIEHCDLTSNGGWGILVSAGANAINSGITAYKCRVISNTSGGIGFYSVIQGAIHSNAIAYNGGVGAVVSHAGGPYSKSVSIRSNEFDSNTATQLQLGYVTGVTESDNYYVCNTAGGGIPAVTKQIEVTAVAKNVTLEHCQPRLPAGYTGVTMFTVASGAVAVRILNTDWSSWQSSGNTTYANSVGDTVIQDSNAYLTPVQADGGGIAFPASAVASSDPNTLDDYEEGTWTPVDSSGAGLGFSGASGVYTKVGRLVSVSGQWIFPTTASGNNIAIGGLPFSAGANTTGAMLQTSATSGDMALIPTGTSQIFIYTTSAVRRTNSSYTGVSVYFSASYIV